eukprot:Rmarinus@m.4678
MILLDAEHPVLRETLERLLSADKKEVLDVEAVDFDNVQYRVSVDPEDKDTCRISMLLPCYKSLTTECPEAGKRYYKSDMIDDPEQKFDVTLKFSLSNPPSEKEELINSIARLKRNFVGAPLDEAFTACMEGKPAGKPHYSLEYRSDETLYVIPGDERVTVIYRLSFQDPVDIEVARVFLEEFSYARRDPTMKNVPVVSFSQEAPGEVKALPGYDASKDKNLNGYVSFVIFKAHVSTPEKKEKAIDLMHSFRNYLHYHIKCAKAYFHSRMRNRSSELLKVLRRAIPEKETKVKKTITGRTFTQK